MNRKLKRLLDAARAQGFDGDSKGLREWIEGSGIEFIDGDTGKSYDLDEVFARKAVYVTADGGEDVRFVDPESDEDKMDEEDDDTKMEEDEDAEKSLPTLREMRREAKRGATSPKKFYDQNRRMVEEGRGPGVQSRRARAVKRYNQKAAQAGQGKGRHQTVFADGETAEIALAQMRLKIAGHMSYPAKQADIDTLRGYGFKASTINDLSSGGAFVSDDFLPDVVYLVEEYGVARKVTGVTPMSRDTLTIPRSDDGFSASWNGEAVAATAQDIDTSPVNLTAAKLMILNQTSSELFTDSEIGIADQLAREFAQQMAYQEDLAYFLGDGTADYGSFKGVVPSLTTISTNPEDGAGVHLGTANSKTSWANFTEGDILATLGLIPHYSTNEMGSIVCHKRFFFQVMLPLLRDTIGTTYADASSGFNKPANADAQFLGMPTYFSQVMPSAPTTDSVVMLAGHFDRGSKFGEVRGSVEFASSDQRYFDSDSIAFRGKERVAINVHDVGTTSAAGPITALITDD